MKNYSPDSRRVTCDLGPSFIVIRRNDETNVYKLKALCLLKIGKLAFLVCCAGGGGGGGGSGRANKSTRLFS